MSPPAARSTPNESKHAYGTPCRPVFFYSIVEDDRVREQLRGDSASVNNSGHMSEHPPGSPAPASAARVSERPRSSSGTCCASSGGDGVGRAWLLLLVPLACCGGPVLIGALAAAGAAVWGVLGGVVALVLGAVAVALMRRRAARRRMIAVGGAGVSRRDGQPVGRGLR